MSRGEPCIKEICIKETDNAILKIFGAVKLSLALCLAAGVNAFISYMQ